MTLFLSFCGILAAQNVSSSLSGFVQDKSGAAFPGVEIKVTSEQTGFVRSTRANSEGFFSFPDLTAANYVLTVESPGFKRYVQSGIELGSSEQRSLGAIRLEIGELAESISVTAEANPVVLSSGERSSSLTGQEIDGIALRGRDFMDVIGLLPGVVDTADSRDAPSPTSIGNIYILGARSTQKNMTVDGVTNWDTGANGSVHTMPSMDSISEVRVLMSNYAAEHGRNSGGTISVVTKGGGRQFHGSGAWYYRHEDLAANDFFNNQRGVTRPPYRYNIFGYTFSGPVDLPWRKKRSDPKIYFFFSQEFQRQLINVGTTTVRVPTALERAGDFSQSMDVNGRLITIYDPLTSNRARFPNNVVPASRFNTVGVNVLKMFPLPNFTDPNPSRLYQWNYIASLSPPYPRRTETLRVDYSPLRNIQMYVRLNRSVDEQVPSYGVGNATGNTNFPMAPVSYRQPAKGAVLHTTATISPTIFNELIFGFSQKNKFSNPVNPDQLDRKALGIDIQQWHPEINPTRIIPNMTFSGVPNYANANQQAGTPYYNANPITSIVENVSKVAGTHTLKFGLYWERARKAEYPNINRHGAISFDKDSNNPLDTNYAYANALLGIYDSYTEPTAYPMGQYRTLTTEWYLQDNWHATRRLTLDFGLRFSHYVPQIDAYNQFSTFVPSMYDPKQAPVLLRPAFDDKNTKVALDPITGKTYPQGLIGTYAPGVGNPAVGMAQGGKNGFPAGLYTVPAVVAAPRFGFAYDLFGNGRTALRGGFGVFYDRIQGNVSSYEISNPPTIYTPTVYYGWVNQLTETASAGTLAPSSSMYSVFGSQHVPSVYNYSLGVQKQLGRNTVVDVSYAGSVSRHLLWERNLNAVPFRARHLDVHPENRDPTAPTKALATNFIRPFMGHGDIYAWEFGGTASYNSLQASMSRRMSRNLQFSASYTFSKVLGSASSDTERVSTILPPRSRNYGPLTYDMTHVFSARYNYTLPRLSQIAGWRPLGIVTDNWELAGITRMSTGGKFTPGISTVDGMDFSGTPSEGARLDVIDPKAPAVSRFGRPAYATLGNAGSGILRLPGVNNWDISLYRRIRLGEGSRYIQLRFETYNTLNHAQFSNVSRSARFDAQGNQIDPLFLQPTATRSPRRAQLALRLNW